MNPLTVFNACEAALWLIISALVARRGQALGASVRQRVILAITFTLFGISDLIEIRTGAWWRPGWLLVWKGICLIAIAKLLLDIWRSKRITTPLK